MSQSDLSKRLKAILEESPGLSAGQLARLLKLTKSEVNSSLYQGKGKFFDSEGDSPPLWKVSNSGVGLRQTQTHLTRKVQETIHIDFQGGDWELDIGVATMSRNDPIAKVERLGLRKRLITVSHLVVSSEEKDVLDIRDRVPDAAISIAASILAWEIFQSLENQDPEFFDFEKAVSDIFLSISAHSLKSPDN